ncbi:MAG: hypothetical protein E7647_04690 [Ruminococcaceae bacterium]|nr:hypothetical protein [Oscillospiraceae bacterium]
MKKIIFAAVAAFVVLASLSGCARSSQKGDPDFDLSTLDFVNTDWERQTDSCTETIYFNDDGSCGYYCACGNPVNDDDLCEGYSYDPETETIYLDFHPSIKGVVREIAVKSCDGETLVLDFEGDLRTFERASDDDDEDEEFHAGDAISYKEDTYTYLEFPGDIFCYDLAEGLEDYEEDEYLPVDHEKWDIIFYNGDLFVLSSQAEEAIEYYSDRASYTWSVIIYDPNDDPCGPYPLTVSEEESDYIYGMEDLERDKTLAFDDIESFASLVKISNDGFISGTTSLAAYDGVWYWRSEIIDDTVEGWPEYVVPLPDAVAKQIKAPN